MGTLEKTKLIKMALDIACSQLSPPEKEEFLAWYKGNPNRFDPMLGLEWEHIAGLYIEAHYQRDLLGMKLEKALSLPIEKADKAFAELLRQIDVVRDRNRALDQGRKLSHKSRRQRSAVNANKLRADIESIVRKFGKNRNPLPKQIADELRSRGYEQKAATLEKYVRTVQKRSKAAI